MGKRLYLFYKKKKKMASGQIIVIFALTPLPALPHLSRGTCHVPEEEEWLVTVRRGFSSHSWRTAPTMPVMPKVLATGTVKHPSVRETARMATMSAGGMTAEMAPAAGLVTRPVAADSLDRIKSFKALKCRH